MASTKKIIIGIQGDVGSTNERACKFFIKKHKWENIEIKYLITTENVLRELNNDKIDYGTFAWRSSRKGPVRETIDAIKKYGYKKVDEESFQLDHALLQNSEINEKDLINIYSHPKALEEHKSYLEKRFKKVKFFEEEGTALSAKNMQNKKYPKNSLIIAPISCAKIYNLKPYIKNIPTNKGYKTTILLVKK